MLELANGELTVAWVRGMTYSFNLFTHRTKQGADGLAHVGAVRGSHVRAGDRHVKPLGRTVIRDDYDRSQARFEL